MLIKIALNAGYTTLTCFFKKIKLYSVYKYNFTSFMLFPPSFAVFVHKHLSSEKKKNLTCNQGPE